MKSFPELLVGLKAVSYTHLTEKLLQISAYSEKSSYEQAQERLSKLNDAVFIAVSYTHLDVYKRQYEN